MKDKKLILRVMLKIMALTAMVISGYVFLFGLFGDISTNKETVMERLDVSAIKPGEVKYFTVFNKKLLVLHRSNAMLSQLDNADITLLKYPPDEDAATSMNNTYRSFSPDYFVAYAYDPFYGCEIKLLAQKLTAICIDISYDLAGRVLQNKYAEDNLIVPRHDMASTNLIRIYAD